MSLRTRSLLVGAALLALAALSLLYGRYPKPGFLNPFALSRDPMAVAIVLNARLPRLVAALVAGAALGASGCAFQLVFANPLVDAGFLGVSQGSSLGSALAMLLGLGGILRLGMAFSLGLMGLGLSVFLASRLRFGGAVLRLVLSGLAVSAFLSACLSLVKYAADPHSQLPEISYWLMGGLAGTGWRSLSLTLPVAAVAVTILLSARWRISLLSLDEATTASLGLKPGAERRVVLFLSAAAVAAVSALAGPVAWVGLVVPHMARLALASDGPASLPASAALGAGFLALCDALARGLLPGELPLGIVTSLLGTAVFIFLLTTRRLRVERG